MGTIIINIILNEKRYAEKVLNEKRLSRTPAYDLRILARYFYFEKKLAQSQIYDNLVELMEAKYMRFSITDWQKHLLDIARQAKKRPLVSIEYIPITKNELETINALNSKKLKRVAFTMLCLAKYRNAANKDNNDWINYEYKEIFKMANVSATIREQCAMIHDMKNLGLIKMNNITDNLSINVCYVDKANSKEVLHITDFRNLGYQYQLHLGENYFKCRKCGLTLKQNAKRTKKLCPECSQYHPIGTKVIKCIDCGTEFEVSSKNTRSCRCNDCKRKNANYLAKERMKKHRSDKLR